MISNAILYVILTVYFCTHNIVYIIVRFHLLMINDL